MLPHDTYSGEGFRIHASGISNFWLICPYGSQIPFFGPAASYLDILKPHTGIGAAYRT